ncbi:MAG: TonB-dependent receptor [Agriterribacter sp.]
MRIKKLTLSVSFILSILFSQAQNGSVKGTIISSDGKPAESISVVLEKSGRGAITNHSGEYEIKNVKPGTYILKISTIGIIEAKEKVTVSANAASTVDFSVSQSSSQLEEIVITTQRQRITSKESDQVARMPISNLENPQVYSVVGKELMKEQIVTTMIDGLKSAPGVVPTAYPSGGIGITSRGFGTEIGARNGLQSTLGRSSADVSNIERIEFIKGPSGALFGAGISSFGGLVNLVTKKPTEGFFGKVDFTMGSFGLARLTADVNTAINEDKTTLLRVNAAINRQNNFSTFGFNNTVALAPSVLFKVNHKLSILLDAEIYAANSTRPTYTVVNAESGYTNYKDLPLAFRQSLYDNDLDSKTQSQKFFLNVKYKINDNWTSNTDLSYVNEQVEYSYQTYNTWMGRDSVSRWVGIWGPVRNTYINAQQNFVGKFNTGFLKHTLLIGFSYTNYNSDGMGKYTNPEFDTVNVKQPYNLVSRFTTDKILSQIGYVNDWGVIKNDFLGAYVSEVLNVSDRLYAMLSLRFDRYIQTAGGLWGDPYNQNSIAPKLGLVYQLVKKKVSVFGNYMSGFQNNGPIQQPDGSILMPKPVYAKQWEAGIKAELFNGKLNSTLSYYNIDINNAIRYDSDNDFKAFQDGKQRSRGIEFELLANPVAGLNIMLGYGYNENKIVDAKTNVGNFVSGVPQNMANYWISYRISNGALKNFGLGAGGNYVSACFFDEANTITIPSYSVVNGTLFYEDAKWRVGFKLNNIGNVQYWDNWGIYNPTRNFAADLAIKF